MRNLNFLILLRHRRHILAATSAGAYRDLATRRSLSSAGGSRTRASTLPGTWRMCLCAFLLNQFCGLQRCSFHLMIAEFQIFYFSTYRCGTTCCSDPRHVARFHQAKRLPKATVILPCVGLFITHFWQSLGPNLEFNIFCRAITARSLQHSGD